MALASVHRCGFAVLAAGAMLLGVAVGCQTHQVGTEQWGPPTATMSGLKDHGMPSDAGNPPMPEGWRGFRAPR